MLSFKQKGGSNFFSHFWYDSAWIWTHKILISGRTLPHKATECWLPLYLHLCPSRCVRPALKASDENSSEKKERPMSTMSEASNYTGGSDYSTFPGSPATTSTTTTTNSASSARVSRYDMLIAELHMPRQTLASTFVIILHWLLVALSSVHLLTAF